MSEADLARSDREYQRGIRQQQLSDKAKIGLLVGLNVQQFQANQLLAQNLRVACDSNEILRTIAGSLDQIAALQATHFEQVQRERQLKEVMYQFEKYLAETERCGDPTAAGYGVKRLFELLDRPGIGFSTADLTNFDDKARFDTLVAGGKRVLISLPKDQYDELEQFESLVGIYLERRAAGFNVEELIPKKNHFTLPGQYMHPPAPTRWRPSITKKQVLILLAILIRPWPLREYKQWRDARQARRQQQESEYAARLAQWERDRKQAEEELAQSNKEIDAHNAIVEDNRRVAQRNYEKTMEDMRSLINRFLTEHPGVQLFVARV